MADNFNISDQAPGVTLPDARGIFTEGQWGYASVENQDKTEGYGVYNSIESQDGGKGASTFVVDASGARISSETGNVTNDEAFQRTKGAPHQLNQNLLWLWKFLLDSNTDVRWFLGLNEAQATSPVASDDIGDPAIGLLFSTSRPDANFQFAAHTGAAQTLIDTGIPVDTADHFLRIDANAAGTSMIVTLLDTAFVVEATTTFTTEGPGPAVELNSQEWLRTLANAEKTHSFYYGTAVARGA